jgi:hypothetical protein
MVCGSFVPKLPEKRKKVLASLLVSHSAKDSSKSAADVGVRKIVEMARTITDFDMNGMRGRLSLVGTKVASIHGLSDVLFPPPPTAAPFTDSAIETGQDRFYAETNHSNVVPLIPFALRLLE